MSEERVCIFIDGSNFYHLLKSSFGDVRIDFGKLAAMLVGERKLVRIYYYNVPVDPEEDPERYRRQQHFFAQLNRTDYLEVRLGRLVKRWRKRCPKCSSDSAFVCNGCGTPLPAVFKVEKGVDVRLAVNMLSLAAKNIYDTAILISGDGDFKDAVQAVKDLGKNVEGVFLPKGAADALKKAVDKRIELNREMIERCRPSL